MFTVLYRTHLASTHNLAQWIYYMIYSIIQHWICSELAKNTLSPKNNKQILNEKHIRVYTNILCNKTLRFILPQHHVLMLGPARGLLPHHTLHCPLQGSSLVWQIQQSTTIQYTYVTYSTPVSTQANSIDCEGFLSIDLPPPQREILFKLLGWKNWWRTNIYELLVDVLFLLCLSDSFCPLLISIFNGNLAPVHSKLVDILYNLFEHIIWNKCVHFWIVFKQ